jgi:hypothetical protein
MGDTSNVVEPLNNGIDDAPIIMMSPSVNTVTFYEGTPPIDYLRGRVRELLDKNPWLGGHIVSRTGAQGIDLTYSPDGCNVENHFAVVNDPEISTDMQYGALAKALLPMQVKCGNDCLNMPEILFRVVVIVSDETHFGLLFSFSHVLGDGFSHYKLYGMLSKGARARFLQARRHRDTMALVDGYTGGNPLSAFLSSPGFVVSAMGTLLLRPRCDTRMHMISQEWVEQQKQDYVGPNPTLEPAVGPEVRKDAPFLSSNDVLTSWWFRFTRSDIGLMAMNLRNRIPELTEQMAGNYEYLAPYQRADFAHPAFIRQSLPSARGFYSGAMPGFLATVGGRISILSSWATFYRDVELEGCEQLLHLPCADDQNVISDNLAVIFRPRKGELAVMSFTRNFTDTDFAAAPALGDTLMGSNGGAGAGISRKNQGALWLMAGRVLLAGALMGAGAALYSLYGGKTGWIVGAKKV